MPANYSKKVGKRLTIWEGELRHKTDARLNCTYQDKDSDREGNKA